MSIIFMIKELNNLQFLAINMTYKFPGPIDDLLRNDKHLRSSLEPLNMVHRAFCSKD